MASAKASSARLASTCTRDDRAAGRPRSGGNCTLAGQADVRHGHRIAEKMPAPFPGGCGHGFERREASGYSADQSSRSNRRLRALRFFSPQMSRWRRRRSPSPSPRRRRARRVGRKQRRLGKLAVEPVVMARSGDRPPVTRTSHEALRMRSDNRRFCALSSSRRKHHRPHPSMRAMRIGSSRRRHK